MNTAINLKKKAAKLKETWSPRVLGEIDDSYAKIAKLKGSLAWHKHDNEDELFLVIDGHLKIELEDDCIELGPGEMYIVPKGVMHNPIAEEECSVFLIERKSTQHTGDLDLERTKSIEEQLKPI
ncbi:cupin domain-containing protein [Pelagicoccus mobilis]|uniref:Cupin domain-containing protein n=1 Tax=Pelagicoccus mobilis TaxID=415221 RepID=A0A934RY74_9BACT|nr:cupin domain-containing protein [Pelagicoccus mobilis]MBK1878756.1 cupin domain-containing protein [Pelagicoccus mobilis]